MIKVKNLTRKYGTTLAVDSISFEIPRGQIVGLLGHNGAGKTTTLKMLTGFLDPTSGSIDIDGIDVEQDRLAVQHKIGYLSESSPLYPEMTIGQYLLYVANMRSIPESEIPSALQMAIKATDLGDKVEQKIRTLSKGYCQRVGVAQAILHKPEILVLDEPTNGLDPTQILAMRNLIKSLSQYSTIIISTHIMQEVEAICDRVIIILNGRIAVDSSMEKLKTKNSMTLSVDQDLSKVEGAIGGLPGVQSIQMMDSQAHGHHFSLNLEGDFDTIAPAVAKTIVDKGWKLLRMNSDQRDLETVFKEVNRGLKGAAHV